MARRQAPLQINGFEGGLNTEFNPLETPPNVSSDELNMELERDKSRRKRLGFSFETNYTEVDSGIALDSSKFLARQLFRWENAGGDPEKTLLVVQVGNHLAMYDVNAEGAVSSNSVYTEELGEESYASYCSFAVVDGILVATTGEKNVKIYSYDNDTIVATTDNLKIRDLFGVEDDSGNNLTSQQELNTRPSFPLGIPDTHTYNLRNQTFAYPRYNTNNEILTDPIAAFENETSGDIYPSNADNLTRHLFEDPNDADGRLLRRFFPENMLVNNPGTSRAPQGFFIIDALERGDSREEQIQNLYSNHPDLTYSVTELPRDATPGGPTVVSEFAGRFWYAGFSGELIGGDLKSPRMSSYILFSVLVNDRTDITQCYQRADPTDADDSALVDTDGGFIRIDGAYGINRMAAISNSLFVFAENGVWRISGGEGNSFSATSYQVEKITDKGCFSPGSVVAIEKSVFYWGRDAIYLLTQNEFGVWESRNVTQKTIQSLYLDIDFNQRELCTGFFDGYERKIRWIYSGEPTVATVSNELVFHLDFGCFTKNEIPPVANNLPLVVGLGETNPYSFVEGTYDVYVDGADVTVSGETVTVDLVAQTSRIREVLYLIVTDTSPTISYSFGGYTGASYYDWGDEEVEYDAYLVTGFITGGEARYKKQPLYLNTFFKKTEDGFDVDLNPTNESSCLLSSRWNWTNNTSGNKWSTARQAYRIGRLYFPEDANDTYDSGDTIISTRNKLRGIGHSVAFKFDSEAGKNLHIYGWSFDLQANAKE